ncbi:MAG TPA: globin [Gemmatimonadales bacterium]
MSRDSEARDLASASYQRCSEQPDFFPSFYRNFFAACPEAAPRFARTDFERQNRLLRHALGLLLVFPRQPEQEPSLLARVAERHSRWDLNVPPSLYPPFVDSLVATVRQYDPAFTPEVEEAWRRTVDKGVKYMIARYDSAD